MHTTARTRKSALIGIVVAVSVAGCGDDPVGLVGDPLSDVEIQAVFSAFSGAFSSLGAAPTSAARAAAVGPAAVSVDQSFDVSVPCQGGGAMAASGSVNGDVDDQTFASDLRFELAFAPDGCVVVTEDGTITVDGDPDVRIVLNSVFDQAGISMTGTERGGIRFTTEDGRSGACGIDIEFSVTTDLSSGAGEQSVSGSICGISASAFEVFSAG